MRAFNHRRYRSSINSQIGIQSNIVTAAAPIAIGNTDGF
jgi:hypothetical protein